MKIKATVTVEVTESWEGERYPKQHVVTVVREAHTSNSRSCARGTDRALEGCAEDVRKQLKALYGVPTEEEAEPARTAAPRAQAAERTEPKRP